MFKYVQLATNKYMVIRHATGYKLKTIEVCSCRSEHNALEIVKALNAFKSPEDFNAERV